MSALTPCRVVELAGSVAGEYCGKLLADFGAEVIKVESPGCGSPTRALAPRLRAGPDGGVVFAYLNTNKLSVVFDAARDGQCLHGLLGTADAVIHDGALSLADRYPDAVFCSITQFARMLPRIRECQEHQRVPCQQLGLSHAQPSGPRQAAVAGARPVSARLRGGPGSGVVRDSRAVRTSAHRRGAVHGDP